MELFWNIWMVRHWKPVWTACLNRANWKNWKNFWKPGMVLVVPSTSNEMLSFVRDAAALVVEEPGLNSHAAIAGKALLKPTVVGAAGATSHIRDGLMVAVDCAHGSVQRLQG